VVYLLSNICNKNYWNSRTNIVEIIVGGGVVSFFESLRHIVNQRKNIWF